MIYVDEFAQLNIHAELVQICVFQLCQGKCNSYKYVSVKGVESASTPVLLCQCIFC